MTDVINAMEDFEDEEDDDSVDVQPDHNQLFSSHTNTWWGFAMNQVDSLLSFITLLLTIIVVVAAAVVSNIVHELWQNNDTEQPPKERRHSLGAAPPLGDLAAASKSVSVFVAHEAISGNNYGWFREEVYHVPLDRGKTIMARRRALRFVTRTHGAVLLVHGFAQNRFAWHIEGRSLANYLAEAGYDVFFIDLRGTRESRRLGAPLPTGCHEYVEIDLCQALRLCRMISGHEKITLIGHSLGGALCCAVAAVMPEYIEGVVHIAGVYGFRHHKTLAWRMVLWLDRISQPIQEMLPKALRLPTREIGLLLRFLRFMINSPFGILVPIKPYLGRNVELHIISRYLFCTFETTSLAILRNITGLAHGFAFVDEKGEDYLQRFSRLHLPLYVICADKDDLVNMHDSLECFRQSASPDKEHLVFISDASGDADPAFGHCDILIGRRAVHMVWARLRVWLDKRRPRNLSTISSIDSSNLPSTVNTNSSNTTVQSPLSVTLVSPLDQAYQANHKETIHEANVFATIENDVVLSSASSSAASTASSTTTSSASQGKGRKVSGKVRRKRRSTLT